MVSGIMCRGPMISSISTRPKFPRTRSNSLQRCAELESERLVNPVLHPSICGDCPVCYGKIMMKACC